MSECEENYTTLMYENGIKQTPEDKRDVKSLTVRITKITQGVVEGNSHYYIMLEGSDAIFDIPVVDFIDIIRYDVGDEVTIEYKEGEQSNTVLSLNGIEKAAEESAQNGDTAAAPKEGDADSVVSDDSAEE